MLIGSFRHYRGRRCMVTTIHKETVRIRFCDDKTFLRGVPKADLTHNGPRKPRPKKTPPTRRQVIAVEFLELRGREPSENELNAYAGASLCQT